MWGWQQEKEAALVPKGMRILPDEERMQMLEALEGSKRDVEQQIQVTHTHADQCMVRHLEFETAGD